LDVFVLRGGGKGGDECVRISRRVLIGWLAGSGFGDRVEGEVKGK
jgi:hypothetical protein